MAIRKRYFETKPNVVQAVQFNGKNGKDLAGWVEKTPTDINQTLKARGFYVELSHESYSVKLTKGEWLVLDGDHFWAWSDDQFKENFQPRKAPISDKKALETLNS